ncbi:syringomycin E biosynthesis non-ribosomal peptide synthetase SyrE, partial [Pseudomonas syringae]
GEIYIGGDGVARGYLNLEEVNAERFLADPFSESPDARMYKTGDLARYMADGRIEYLGRNDFQVKVRGFRIELGEIEARLGNCTGVKEAVVIAREDNPGDKRLVAYVVAQPQSQLTAADLRAELAPQLAEYMLPSAFVLLDELPLTPNRKLDRKALPAPDADALISRGYEAPQGETETQIVAIWQDLLGIEQVGRHDHFFELGGHSLLAVSLIERLRKQGLNLNVKTVFTAPTVREMALAISQDKHVLFQVPANRIPAHCTQLTPDMLPLVELSVAQIELITSAVAGGAANIQDIYPLAPLQDGILFHYLLNRERDAYLMRSMIEFDSRARLDAFLEGLQTVIDRHDILRSSVHWIGLPQAVQVVHRQAQLPVHTLTLTPEEDALSQLDRLSDPGRLRLDLRQAPLLLAYIARDPNSERWLLALIDHHMISDHVTVELILEEIRLLMRGQSADLLPPQPYRDFVAQTLASPSSAHEAYFTRRLADVDSPTAPFELLEVQGDGNDVEEARLALSSDLCIRIRTQARERGMSPAVLFHVAWAQVMARCTGRDDVVFGTVVTGRLQGTAGAERAMGMFMNTLPVRVQLTTQGAQELVMATHRDLSELLSHEQASLALAQRCSSVATGVPLFSSLLNYRHQGEDSRLQWPGMRLLDGTERTNYPLCLSVNDYGSELDLIIHSMQPANPQRLCAMMQCALEQLTDALAHTPQMAVTQLDVLPAAERNLLLETFNQTRQDYPTDLCIQHLFEAQVRTQPDAIAVAVQGQRLSYADLNRQANRLAHHLISLGIVPDDRVAICVERGVEMMIGLLGVLKAGAAYVPLDPAYPAERLAYMITDSQPAALLTQRGLQERLPALSMPLVLLDDEQYQGLAECDDNPVVPTLGVRNLAYVIYTSGSTGNPKGVMIEHRGLVNYSVDAARLFDLSQSDTVLQQNTLNFDLSVEEIFPALLAGATLAPSREIFGSEGTETHGIQPTVLHLTTAHWHTLVAEWHNQPQAAEQRLQHVRLINVTGDALSAQKLKLWDEVRPAHTRLINTYGPTEATVSCTAAYVSHDAAAGSEGSGNATIGKPMANTRIYLLDAHQQPVPYGVAGEIYIGGDGVARGYLNLEEVNAERFLADPFSESPDARMYKTGDLARYMADGRIEYLGRNDFQVKVRGFRIELGEIEARLGNCKGVKEAVVIAREDNPGEKRLVAYVVAQPQTQITAAELRAELAPQLAEYMLPSAFVLLDELPLTPNRKLDRKALPAPADDAFASREHVEPQGATEIALAQIWQNLLDLERVGRHDQFFELGGHSLLAMRLISQVRHQLGVELGLAALFAHPELSALAVAIAQAGRSKLPDIVPVARDQAWPLSFGQQRLWFLAQMEGASAAYHIPAGLSLHGNLNLKALQRALERIVARHEGLRTTFMQGDDGQPVQRISPADTGFNLQMHDLQGLADAEEKLQALASEESLQSFDLQQGPLIRGRLIRMAEDHHVLLLTLHHIVSDGWSVDVLTRELSALYAAFSQDQDDPLAPLELQYLDYAVWQRRWLSGDVLQQQSNFWQQTLADAPALLMLPTDRARPALQDYAGAALPVVFDKDLTRGLKALSQRRGSTLFMTVMAAWAGLLGRLAGQDDVVIGTPVANRTRSEVEGLVGLFVNTLAIRVDLSDKPTAETLLARVKQQTLDAQAHQDLPFEQVVEVINPLRSLSHSPIFQAMLSWENNEASDLTLGDMTLKSIELAADTAQFDLTLDMAEVDEQLVGTLEYATALFDESTMRRYLGYFQRVLEAMVADDQQVLEHVALLGADEREHLLAGLNATEAPFPQDRTIHQLFEERVQAQPDAIAVAFGAQRLSYAELNRQANRVAHHLISLGIKPDDRVAICVERGVEMLIGVLGVLKAGAAYVPLDPAYPAERLAYMIEDSTPSALLAQRDVQAHLPTLDLPLVLLDEDQRTTLSERGDNPVVETLGAHNLAYVIYTSGSTGVPKGVMVEHRGLFAVSAAWEQLYALHAPLNHLQMAGFSFDVFSADLIRSLAFGGTLVLCPRETLMDPPALYRLLSEESIGFADFVPAVLNALLGWVEETGHDLSFMRTVVCGSDIWTAHSARQLRKLCGDHVQIVQAYGVTEASIDSTCFEFEATSQVDGVLPIGRALANTRIYLLDELGQAVPPGVAGELYIGGAGIARGYLNLQQLTAERFMDNPFVAGERLYRSGDMARYRADGNIEFLGRNDSQAKLRGLRLELGEIEARLAEVAGVRESLVVIREDSGGTPKLIAYFVEYATRDESGPALTPRALRQQLQLNLPEYMIPAAFVRMAALPLSANGKLDRRALPEPDADAFDQHDFEAADGPLETAIAAIWADVLGVAQVGRHDDFFALGGHSLLVMRVLAQVRQQLNLEVSPSVFFAAPVLRQFAERLGNTQDNARVAIKPVQRSGALPLSFAQQRLWFLAQLEGGSAAYHIPAGLRLRGNLDQASLQRALDRIVARHEALRTTFVQEQGQPAEQRISAAETGFRLQLQVLAGQTDAEDKLLAIAAQEASEHFDLVNGPLVRGRLVRMADDDHVLLVTMHHIVSDGWSTGVLNRELGALYDAFRQGADDPLPALPVQYVDYALWQRDWLSGDVLQQQRQYWQQALAGAPALLTLPTDRPRPAQQDYSGQTLELVLDTQLTRGLKTLSQRHGSSLFMTVMGAWAALLGRLSGQDDVVIGTPVANRMSAEVENLIGFFVNTLAIRVDLSGTPSVEALVRQVKQRTLAAQANQDLPFEQVVEVVQPQRSLSHSPIFQAMLSWQNNEDTALVLGDLTLQGVAVAGDTAKFDLALDIGEVDGQLIGTLEYATALFDESTMRRYRGYFLRLLEAMAADDQQVLEQVPLLDTAEREYLLKDINATERTYPVGQLMHRLFEAHAEAAPQAIAVRQGEQTLTYAELDSRANALAQHLRKHGVGPGTRVAILLDRSVELLASMLATLKCGAAYLALDRLAPEERLRFMLEDSEAIMLLSRSDLTAPDMTPRLDLDTLELSALNQEPVVPATEVAGETPACIIYTSGSTGVPKGVIVTHNGIVRLVQDNGYYDFSAEDRVAFSSNPAFDASTPEIWGALLNGCQSVIIEPQVLLEPVAFAALLKRHGVTAMISSTALFNLYAGLIPEALAGLRMIMCGGERADPASFRRVREHSAQVRLFNGYGPTEGTTCATSYEIFDVLPDTLSLPIGKPNANVRVYVLDARREPVPMGVVGEIYIGGTGVALGYLNRPELTAERFSEDPFSQQAGARLYRTGDLARWLPDGNLEYLARNDGQVKVRGFRVELGEIESVLHLCDGVRNSVVVAHEASPGDTRLVAYYTVHAGVDAPDPEDLRAQLSADLAEYMVPSVFVRLDALPLTLNGKVDQKALPVPDLNAMFERTYVAPEGATEQALAEIFQELLGLERVGRHDGFFELGGHSLLAAQLVSRVRQQLNGDMALRQLFNHPTVAELAKVVDGLQTVDSDSIEPIERNAPLALSFSQQRLWFLDRLDPGASSAYHMPMSLLLRGELDHRALKAALDRLVARHESLRTTFELHGEQPVQVIAAADSGFALAEDDLRSQPYEQASLNASRIADSEAAAPFDLRQGPLIRGRLLRLADDEHMLLITQHHIISDGWSVGVLINEFTALYQAFTEQRSDPLPALSIQYADYAAWQRRTFTGERLAEQADFWREHLGCAPTLLSLPTDRPRPAVQSYRGGAVPVTIDAALHQRLERFCQAHNVTLFMGLLSAWSVLMTRLGNERDVVIGVPSANRGRTETENLIGFFVNTLALRVDLTQNPSVAQLLEQVRQTTLAAHEHQDIPFEQVIEALQPPRSMSHSPLCQVALSLDNTSIGGELKLPGLSLHPVLQAHETAQFDLMLTLASENGALNGVIEYASDLFDRSTVERFAQHFHTLLEAMVEDVAQPVLGLPLLSPAQRLASPALLQPKAVFASGLMVHQRFEQFAAAHPQNIALVFGRHEVSYQALNRRANRLAHELLAQGVRPDDRVAILAERGTQMICAVLAVLKSGAAYVPLDPTYPTERLGYLLTDSAPVALLAQSACLDVLPAHSVPVLTLGADNDSADLADESLDRNPEPAALGLSREHLAYVIYTSGSTGLPKGVLVEHGNVARLFDATAGQFNFGHEDVWTLFHSFAFDFSVWEIWGALCYGGKLVIVPSEVARSPDDFYALVCEQQVTVLNQTPSAFRQFIQARERSPQEHALREVVFGGEALDFRSLQPWTARTPLSRTRLVNMYGITEITVHATYYPISQSEIDTAMPSLIGPALDDLCLRILDDYQQPVPVGVNGEIYIGGAGVARHYLNRTELNAERFIADPYALQSGARLYRTGDVAHYRSDGGVVYVGRNDSQIKIRGFRIELGEIEAQLLACPDVREAMVIVREDRPGDKRLVAYLIAEDGAAPESALLRSQLASVLAEHMLPSAFVTLETWPLTTNGKLDRAALPAPDQFATVSRDYEAPLGAIETTLAAAWQELLGVERVGRQDHFFELGGHSFLVISLIERLRQIGLLLDVSTVFSAPTLQAMAAVLAGGTAAERVAPANLIPVDCTALTPDMLPLVKLTRQELEHIVADVPGGVANVQDIYPLSSLQEGILFHHLLQSEGDAYLMRTLATFDSRALLDKFLGALQVVINRHDIMRSSLRWQGLPQPVQVVHRQAQLPVIQLDTAPGEDALQMLRERTNTYHMRLDLQQAPLIAAYITYDTRQEKWLMALLDHHLISDNVTLRLIMGEIQAVMDGRADALPPSQPYRNFIARAACVSQAEHEAYFSQLLGDVDTTTAPYGVLDVRGGDATILRSVQDLSDDLSARIHSTARAQGVPTSVLFHAAWGLVVAATSGCDDGIFGTVLSGRSQGTSGANHALGMFINTLPMRIRLQQNSVRDIVQDAYQQLSGLLTHEQAPLALAQRCSAVDASLPMFTVILNCRHGDLVNTAGENIEDMGEEQEGVHFLGSETRTNYPIEIAVANEANGFSLTAQSIDGIDPHRIAAYLGQAVAELVNALEQDPARLASSLEVIPQAERQLLLNDFNDTASDFAPAVPIHALFEDQVRRNPDAVALVYEDRQLSYRQLNRRANHVARQLLQLGVQPDERVAICAERSLDMIVGLLGVLKSGAAYVPIDPAHPADRMAFMLQDSQPRALLTQGALSLPVGDTPLMLLDSAESLLAADDQAFDANPVVDGLTAENLAYVIYTSGSTGQSKGVMVEHRSVFNFWNVLTRTTHQHCPTPATVALNAGFFFDMSIKGISQLFSGHKLVIIPQLLRANGSELLDFLEAHQVHAFDSTPSQLDTLLSAGLLERSSYQPVSVLLGGEAINASTWEKLRNCPTIRFYNMYGPTECTVDATIDLIRDLGEKPSIGRPIANVQVHVLDARGEPAPLGVAGEIHIGGSGVARGYLNRDELSAERFIVDPFSDVANARLYKTGDLGRWLADGTLEYMGRNDFQVKVRGFRIELGEIENVLLAVPGIREVVVIARNDSQGDSDSQRLVAYVCGESVAAEHLRSELLRHLPEYMVPSAFVQLDALPLTANGKLDRRALPAPGQDALASKVYEAPQGETEEAIAEIWKALLHLDQVGRNDGFLELGGHSLLAVQLLSRLRRKLGTRITLRELFDAPTVRGLASLVNAAAPGEAQSIPRANRSGRLPLSFSQQRLWFLDHLDHAAGAAYHLPMALRLTGALDTAALEATLDRLVARHETLRTRFELVDGEPVQKIAPADSRFPLLKQDLRDLSGDERTSTLARLGQENATQLFDLTKGPMLRGHLLRVADAEHVLLITLHHIVSDGWSNSVLAQEVSALYAAFSQGQKDPLPALPLQYVDYAAWQRQSLDGPALQAQIDFWRKHLEGAPSVLNLPLDRPRPAIQSYTGGMVEHVFSPALSADLRAFSQAQGSTPFMVLLAGWSMLMSHLSGQTDVVVGTPVANRQHPELEPMIGFFANTLALRVATDRETRLNDMLDRIKSLTLAAYNHQDLPFEQVVSALQPTRNMSHSPLFQVMLSLDNTPPSLLQLPDLEVELLDSEHHTTQFDLSLSLVDSSESLSGGLQYSSDLFDKTTAQAIMQLFARVLENMVSDARQSIGQVLDNTPALPRSAHTATIAATVEDEQPEALPYEAPEGETEIALANLWKELLKLEKVSRHDDFFKLGGISLMAVQMASRLRKVLGKPIAVRDLFIEPTIAGFARTLDGQARPGQHSNLVPVRRTGSQRPLFLVHPLGGEVQYVRDLAAAIDPQVPLYGLAASGLAAGETPLFEVPAMAARYLAAIRQVQPKGPYRIGGWSAGGLIAYEMARQLQSSGEKLEFLGIIDTSARLEQQAPEALSEGQFLMDWLPEQLDPEVFRQLTELAGTDAIDEMLALCMAHRLLPEELPQDVDATLLRSHLAVAHATHIAIGNYVSPPAPLTVTLFTASAEERDDPLLGWTALLDSPVNVTELPGTHETLVRAPQVSALGQAISRALNKEPNQEPRREEVLRSITAPAE